MSQAPHGKIELAPDSATGLLEVIKVSRPGFYPTHVWFYVLPFAQRYMFDSLAFWVGAVYVCFPLGLLLYGWNDIFDAQTDALNPRKGNWLFGARPGPIMRRRLPWIILGVQLPFAILFVSLGGWKMLGWFVLAVVFNGLYNNLGWKQRPFFDLLNQVGYLLVFLLATWLCQVPQLSWPAMVFSALFAMQSHLFGQIMDLDEDRAAQRRTTAVSLGVMPSKLLLAGLMLAEATIALNGFRGWQVGLFFLAGALFFGIDAIVGPRRYPLWFVTLFFVGWNLVVFVTVYFIWRDGLFLLA